MMNELYRPRSECVSVVCWPKIMTGVHTEDAARPLSPALRHRGRVGGDPAADHPAGGEFNDGGGTEFLQTALFVVDF